MQSTKRRSLFVLALALFDACDAHGIEASTRSLSLPQLLSRKNPSTKSAIGLLGVDSGPLSAQQALRLRGGTSFSKQVAPVLGATLANVMFLSGLPEVLAKRKLGSLGEFNPLPFPVIFGNCLGWLAYSFVQSDVYVAAANAPGLILAMWYFSTAMQLADKSVARRVETLMIGLVSMHVAAGCVCAFVMPTKEQRALLYGVLCNAVLLAYYGAPLSTIGKVLRQKSADSIYFPTVLCNGVNGAFWAIYALAIGDWYIFAPNAIGVLLAAIQSFLCVVYK
jgi:solute carrier family 50 protein (sugar transporter)